MRMGLVFPQTEIGTDPAGIADFARAAEELGYDHLIAYDHVLGADPASRPGWKPPYTYRDPFHEPLVLFGYLAAVTRKIEFVTGILVLPQRQTALVAKQAAAVDVLSGGRLRMGIGIGWNPVEYECLGENFHDRGLRSEEQLEVMRLLWTRDVVTFQGRWHKIQGAGINPLPVQRPIPVWFGGGAQAVLRRVGRLGNGWLPLLPPGDKCKVLMEKIRSHARAAGRSPDAIGLEGRVLFGEGKPAQWLVTAQEWKALGATHISFNSLHAGLAGPSQHADAIRRFKEAVAGIEL